MKHELCITESIIDETNWCNIEHHYGFHKDSEITSIENAFKRRHKRFIEECYKSLQGENL